MRTLFIHNSPVEHIITRSLLWGMLGGALLYGMVAYSLVLDTVDRRTMERESSELRSQIGILEESYITRTKAIDLSLAHAHGLRESHVSTYISRGSSLGFRGASQNEI